MRFKCFTEEWIKYKVSDVLETFSTNSLTWDDLTYQSGNLKNIHYGLIHNGFTETGIYFDNQLIPYVNVGKEPKKYTPIKAGDLILADASEDKKDVGRPIEILENKDDYLISGLHTIHARDKLNITSIGYKGFYFQSKGLKEQIHKIANGSKIYGISPNSFKELIMYVPAKEEQDKIVKLLQLIEDRITTQNKIIEDYKILKNWLIHSIFNKKNKEVKLGNVISEINERNKSQKVKNVLSVSNKMGFIKQSEQFEDRDVASEDTSNYKIVTKGNYAYNPARINVGSIARLISYENGIISPMYSCFQINTNKITFTYFDIFLKSNDFKKQLNKKLEGSVRQCLTFDGMLSMTIKLPSLEEQIILSKKIDVIDLKIKLEDDHLKLLQNQKKWLLANMFI